MNRFLFSTFPRRRRIWVQLLLILTTVILSSSLLSNDVANAQQLQPGSPPAPYDALKMVDFSIINIQENSPGQWVARLSEIVLQNERSTPINFNRYPNGQSGVPFSFYDLSTSFYEGSGGFGSGSTFRGGYGLPGFSTAPAPMTYTFPPGETRMLRGQTISFGGPSGARALTLCITTSVIDAGINGSFQHCRTKTFQVSNSGTGEGVDLVADPIQGVFLSPTTLELTYLVRNVGTTAAAPFTIQYFASGGSRYFAERTERVSNGLAPGATHTIRLRAEASGDPTVPVQEWQATTWADYVPFNFNGEIPEPDNGNNLYEGAFRYTGNVAPRPDLFAQQAFRLVPISSNEVEVIVPIRNGGSAAAPAFPIRFVSSPLQGYPAGDTVATDLSPQWPLVPGESRPAQKRIQLRGNHQEWAIRVCADQTAQDTTGIVSESNEANNCALITYRPGPGDGPPPTPTPTPAPQCQAGSSPLKLNFLASNDDLEGFSDATRRGIYDIQVVDNTGKIVPVSDLSLTITASTQSIAFDPETYTHTVVDLPEPELVTTDSGPGFLKGYFEITGRTGVSQEEGLSFAETGCYKRVTLEARTNSVCSGYTQPTSQELVVPNAYHFGIVCGSGGDECTAEELAAGTCGGGGGSCTPEEIAAGTCTGPVCQPGQDPLELKYTQAIGEVADTGAKLGEYDIQVVDKSGKIAPVSDLAVRVLSATRTILDPQTGEQTTINIPAPPLITNDAGPGFLRGQFWTTNIASPEFEGEL